MSKSHDALWDELVRQMRREFPDSKSVKARKPGGVVLPLSFETMDAVTAHGNRKWGKKRLILKDKVGRVLIQKDVPEISWAREAVNIIIKGNRLCKEIEEKEREQEHHD